MTDTPKVEDVMEELEDGTVPETAPVKSFQIPMRAVRTAFHHDTEECTALLEFTGVVRMGNPTMYLLKCSGCGAEMSSPDDPTAISWVDGKQDQVH